MRSESGLFARSRGDGRTAAGEFCGANSIEPSTGSIDRRSSPASSCLGSISASAICSSIASVSSSSADGAAAASSCGSSMCGECTTSRASPSEKMAMSRPSTRSPSFWRLIWSCAESIGPKVVGASLSGVSSGALKKSELITERRSESESHVRCLRASGSVAAYSDESRLLEARELRRAGHVLNFCESERSLSRNCIAVVCEDWVIRSADEALFCWRSSERRPLGPAAVYERPRGAERTPNCPKWVKMDDE